MYACANVCMYLYIMYVHVCDVYTHVSCAFALVRLYVCVRVSTCACVSACVSACVYVDACTYDCVCVCVCECVSAECVCVCVLAWGVEGPRRL